MREDYRRQRLSFAFETVFSHPSTLLDMHECRTAGYQITLVFVTTENPEINVARVAGRVRHGGHAVDPDKIRERHVRSMRYLPRVVEEADYAVVFDSTQEGPMRRCFSKRRFITRLDPPDYLERSLFAALDQRQADRIAVRMQFGPVTTPDEDAGDYTGPIRRVLPSFAVQATGTTDVGGTAYVLHDCLLFPDAASVWKEAWASPSVRLRYRQGEGTLMAATPPASLP